MKPSSSMYNIIKNSIAFYKSRNYSEEEMIHDIMETLHVTKDDVKYVISDIKRQ